MSRTKLTDYERACLAFECTRCGAARGEWCHVRPSRLAEWSRDLHFNRYQQARRISGWLGHLERITELQDRTQAISVGITGLIREAAERRDFDLISKLRTLRGW